MVVQAAGKLNADGTPIEGQAAFWTEQAATCVLQSIKHSPKDHGKRVVKIIHALGFSKHPVAVGRALQRHVDAIPLWSLDRLDPAVVVSLAQTGSAARQSVDC